MHADRNCKYVREKGVDSGDSQVSGKMGGKSANDNRGDLDMRGRSMGSDTRNGREEGTGKQGPSDAAEGIW